MNRQEFVKNILALTGTAFVLGCDDNIDFSSMGEELPEISLDESKSWFENTYLPQQKSANRRSESPSISRGLKWEDGIKVKKDKTDVVWVPVLYTSPNQLPTLITWQDGQEYIPKLAAYLKWSIAEGFIVFKNKKNETQGHLIQVAYDPFKHKPGTVIDNAHFTGMIIHTDWNEEPARVWRYLDGHIDTYYDREQSSSLKTTCQNVYFSYQTVTGQSCGPNCWDVTYHLHRVPYPICNTGINGSGDGYPYTGGGGGGGGTGVPTPPTNSVYSPFINHNYVKVAQQSTPDYQIFMERLNTTLNVLNVSVTTFGLSATYADVFVKTLGMENATVLKTSNALSTTARALGVAGVFVGTVQVVIAISDGQIVEADYYNIAAIGLGVVATATPIGWLALTAGVASAAVGFYATSLTPTNP